jgi:hypothetical protein
MHSTRVGAEATMAKIFWYLIVPMLTVMWLYHAYAGELADRGGASSTGTPKSHAASAATQ